MPSCSGSFGRRSHRHGLNAAHRSPLVKSSATRASGDVCRGRHQCDRWRLGLSLACWRSSRSTGLPAGSSRRRRARRRGPSSARPGLGLVLDGEDGVGDRRVVVEQTRVTPAPPPGHQLEVVVSPRMMQPSATSASKLVLSAAVGAPAPRAPGTVTWRMWRRSRPALAVQPMGLASASCGDLGVEAGADDADAQAFPPDFSSMGCPWSASLHGGYGEESSWGRRRQLAATSR